MSRRLGAARMEDFTDLHLSRWRSEVVVVLRALVAIAAHLVMCVEQAARAASSARAVADRAAGRSLALRRGRGALPALAVNATTSVTFTWRTPMPVATYDVEDELPDLVLGRVSRISMVTAPDKAVITYKASAVTVAGQVSATATALV